MMQGDGGPIMANSSAKSLVKSMGPDDKEGKPALCAKSIRKFLKSRPLADRLLEWEPKPWINSWSARNSW